MVSEIWQYFGPVYVAFSFVCVGSYGILSLASSCTWVHLVVSFDVFESSVSWTHEERTFVIRMGRFFGVEIRGKYEIIELR